MIKINYKSDFDFSFFVPTTVETEVGMKELDIPDISQYDFWGYIIGGFQMYEFSHRGDAFVNCFVEDGKIHVVVNDHVLSPSVLKLEFYIEFPNPIFPDGTRQVCFKMPLEIELVRGVGDAENTPTDFEVYIPYAIITAYEVAHHNGYAGTKEDFYETLSDLPRVADVLHRANQASEDAAESAAEATRQANALKDMPNAVNLLVPVKKTEE